MSREIVRDVFILSVILIVVAYYAGATKFGVSILDSINKLLLTITGRDSSGNFSAYPSNPPTSGIA